MHIELRVMVTRIAVPAERGGGATFAQIRVRTLGHCHRQSLKYKVMFVQVRAFCIALPSVCLIISPQLDGVSRTSKLNVHV
jgi:hypothetical protein